MKTKNKKLKEINKLMNKNGSVIKEETFIDFNKYNGRKKYLKLSTMGDQYGIPFVTIPISSKQYDNTTLQETIKSVPINLNTLRNSKVNRFKQILIADAGYDSEANREYLKQSGYIPVIAYNPRNTQDKEKKKKKEFTKKENETYKKRRIIEPSFAWMKNFPVINQNYEKTISSYMGLVSLASSIIIAKKI